MPRQRRNVLEGMFYHLMARGNNRQKIFQEDLDYEKFLALLKWAKKKNPFHLYHYVLMPNHVHFLAQVQKAEDLGKAMQRLLQGYSDYFRGKNSLVGHLWQGRYKSVLLPTERSLLFCGRYIELNPVRAAIVKKPEDYSWSSYGFYTGKRGQSPFLEESPGYLSLGNSAQERAYFYKEIVYGGEREQEIREEMGLERRIGRPKKGTVPFFEISPKKGTVPFFSYQ